MPNLQQKVNNTFIKGLITESGELTFPENASVDELNCELFRDGSRRRRKAIVNESGATQSSFSISNTTRIVEGDWDNVNNDSSKSFLVVQSNSTLYFYNKGSFPFSAQEVSGSVSLTPYEVAGTQGISTSDCQFASIFGALVVVNKSMTPVYIEYDGTNFTVTEIDCKIRDLQWVTCRDGYDESVPAADITPQRHYDTLNAGWVGDLGGAALTAYISGRSAYPPLTHTWFSGKNSSGDFSLSEWEKIYAGSSLIGNGHFILDLFNRDRSTVSGVSGLDVEIETNRFTTVTSFSNRVFFSGLTSSKNTGKIYYSQTIQGLCDLGMFYQQNDPTSEDFSDLLETDGGYISIPDAREIKRIYAFRNSLFIFAENGVWQIKGVDDVFSPTAYSVSRITELGILSASSFASVEGVPFWWSRHGIHTLAFDEFGNASEQNLSVSTIQTFWNEISIEAKRTVKTAYDRVNKKILWLYKNNGEAISNKYNKVLILDVILQAFYPWQFADEESNSDYVLGLSFYSGGGAGEEALEVTVLGDLVVSNSDSVVSTQETPLSSTATSVVFLTRNTLNSTMTMSLVSGTSFLDWGTADFSSYAETGFDFLGDAVLKKTAPYFVFYLRETETGWEEGTDGYYEPTNPSSMFVSSYWDYRKSPSSFPQQVYKRAQPILVDEDDLETFTSPSTVVTTRIKLRGRGRSLRLKFESETGKDFIYLGHGMISDGAARF